MLYLESLVENILASEGQILLGLDYITDALKLDMKKIEGIFTTCIKQYARRRPVEVTKDFMSGPLIQLPSDVLSVKSIRWGILPDYPSYFQPAWDESTYQPLYDPVRKAITMKVFPPNTQIKVTYNRVHTITNSSIVQEVFEPVPSETVFEDKMQNTYKQGTLNIIKGTLNMVETARNPSSNPGKILLSGTLGTGIIDIETRDFEITLNDTTGGELYFNYYCKYKYCEELDIGDYIFYKFFALNILRAIASLKAQNTQPELHNIDLTTEDLMERVRQLDMEVRGLLKTTISFGGLAQI
jgi:hypothetical protein